MASKAGAAHFMRSAALELAAFNITVNAIAPGIFVTNIGGGHAQKPEVQRAFSRVIPMHRVGFPADMHGLALFFRIKGLRLCNRPGNSDRRRIQPRPSRLIHQCLCPK